MISIHKNSGPSLVVSLSIAVIVFGIVLGIIIGVYAYLRCGITLIKSNNNKCDAQELTPRKSTTEVPEVEEIGLSFTNPMVSNGNDQDETDSPASSASQMEAIRRQVWLIPRASLELSHEVIGRGKYGSVVNGHILKIPTYSNQSHESDFKVNVQVASSVESRKSLSRDLELVVRYGSHMNVLNLLGLSDGDELMNKTLFIVFEKTTQSLKRILVDSRALLHYPVYAEKNNRFTTLQENNVMDVLIGVARGMQHLVKNKILHKKLCARNIFLSPENVPKISGIGVAEYSEPGAMFWSFAVLMWEVVTIGGTPYADLKTGVIPNRVQRGMRVAQTNYMSDDIYQTMLQCWQLDLDERPSFSELEEILNKYSQQQETLKHITFENYVGFQYEMYVPELEVKSVAPPNSQYV
ncbi:unnamed protein product [Lepeophtheirus salmonis]|uniref:(salmon louse) hypothetical protein n=1 Tax=Lepeophtheirus salmonis TaxID=72036 RepID=A0A7R8CZ49_LEPSM|nr:unnamed protein product [Lepeophtheirus salmonis]CAF2973764.1 unnamed protein product [Lepeophtheirus salmonis]